MIKWGVKITDIGIDAGRLGIRNTFYGIESATVSGYANYVKWFFFFIIWRLKNHDKKKNFNSM